MNKNKIGTLFLVSTLALAGVGVSYAGLFDEIFVSGYVETATVDIIVDEYSGTYVWKVWGPGQPEGEVLVTDDPDYDPCAEDFPNCQCERVAFAEGRPWVLGEDEPKPDGNPYDAVIEFSNLFPCIDFWADVRIHYIGSIPAKVVEVVIDWEGDQEIEHPVTGEMIDWIDYLEELYISSGGEYGLYYELVPNSAQYYPQLHHCHHLKLNVFIHLPQNNIFQGLTGHGNAYVKVRQWNDDCDETGGDKNPVLPEDITCTATVYIPYQYDPGRFSYFKTILSGLWLEGTLNPDDIPYNVWNGDWVGWCVDNTGPGAGIDEGVPYTVWLFDSYNIPNPLPGGWTEIEPHCGWIVDDGWPYVNWIINHKPATHSVADVQDAIWYFVDGGVMPPMGSVAYDLVQGALNNPEAGNYHPDEGEWIAVVVWIDPMAHYPGTTCVQGWHQVTIIEVDP